MRTDYGKLDPESRVVTIYGCDTANLMKFTGQYQTIKVCPLQLLNMGMGSRSSKVTATPSDTEWSLYTVYPQLLQQTLSIYGL